PPAQPDGIAELLDEPVAVVVSGDHQGVRRLVDDAVDAEGAVGPANVVLANDHPGIAIYLTRADAFNGIHPTSIAAHGSVTGVLLASLNPSAVAAGHDLADAVRIGG